MRSAARPLAALIAGQLLAGVVIGLIWLWWAPRTISYLVPLSPGGPDVVIPDETESQIAGDGRFFVLCLIIGLAAGLAAWLLLRRQRGPVTLIALAVGGVVSSLVAAGVGWLFSSGTPHPAVQTAYHPRLSLHSPAMLVIQSLFAVAIYIVFAGLTSDPEFTGFETLATPPSAPELPASV